MFDSHCHINDEKLLDDVEGVISRAKDAGVTALLCIGWDYESSLKAIEIAEAHDGVYALVGFHPENIEGLEVSEIDKIEALLDNPKVVGVGEIGLDHHWYKDPLIWETQKKWFIAQIELANKHNLPVSIHARDAVADTYAILKEHPIKAGAVLHCYSGSVEMVREFAKLGLYFGFDGPITYKNAKEPKECAKECPIDRILVETDCPYLTPVPHRGEVNEPRYIPHIVKTIADLRGLSENELNLEMGRNFERLFRVKHG